MVSQARAAGMRLALEGTLPPETRFDTPENHHGRLPERTLTFVVEQDVPSMRELSPYHHVHAPTPPAISAPS